MTFDIYTKDSYSHQSLKRLVAVQQTEDQAISKLKELREEYPGVIFFSEPETLPVDGMEGT